MVKEDFKNIKSSPRDLRNFGLSVGAVIFLFGFFFWLKGRDGFAWLSILGLVLVLLGFFRPSLLKSLQKPWMMLAVILGWIMTRVILTIVFFLVFTPLHLISKIFKKEFLTLNFKKEKESYWIYRKPESFNKEELEKQF